MTTNVSDPPAMTTQLVDPATLTTCELTVVVPVYNEEESLPTCVASWIATLDRVGIDYRLLVIDDGSTDATAATVAELDRHERVVAVSKPNQGHGPTILEGYRVAARTSEWVFQVDSDDEIPADAFPALWMLRHGVQAVFGIRLDRYQSLDRKLISWVAALTNRVLLRGQVTDVNVPFRLMRADALRPIVDVLPDDTFAPNVVIAGVLSRDRAAFAELPVPFEPRRSGSASIVGWGALRAAARSFVQTVKLARAL